VNEKDDFVDVDALAMLDRLAVLPIRTCRYREEDCDDFKHKDAK